MIRILPSSADSPVFGSLPSQMKVGYQEAEVGDAKVSFEEWDALL